MRNISYQIDVSPAALADIREATAYIAQDSPRYADRWTRDIVEIIKGLGEMPRRFARLPEEGFSEDYRSCRHKSHRVIYYVDDSRQAVTILRVVHQA